MTRLSDCQPHGFTTPAVKKPSFADLPPLALYVHIPWCVRKCPYCDFYSHEKQNTLPEKEYIEAVLHDLRISQPLVEGRRIESIFIGGGTPSLFSAHGIDSLLSGIAKLFTIRDGAEITLEANPGTFEVGKFSYYRQSGINRLSLGIQSFNQEFLHRLGRIHDSDEAAMAAEFAIRYFDNFNLDLMYGLPGQTEKLLEDDVKRAISFSPTHLSFYQLTIEPNTYYYKHPPMLPDEDAIDAMQKCVEEVTGRAGYVHYEVSAYALPDKQCFHNRNYWEFGDYLGVGAAAHSKITLKDHSIVRQMRTRNPMNYMHGVIDGKHIEEQFGLSSADLGFEFMMNALRLQQGFPATLFDARTGLDFSVVSNDVEKAINMGLLSLAHGHVQPTELGKRFLNDLQEIFLPD